ncbi:MAG: hydroxymethylbilane synthase [Candidatus Comchoanobacterales bacterium]
MSSQITVKVISRSSPLAVYQAEQFRHCLGTADIDTLLMTKTTVPDRHLDKPLSAFDKCSFTKEIDQVVKSGAADVAIHSAKDMGVHMPEGLVLLGCLPVSPYRGDVLVSQKKMDCWLNLSEGSIIGTGSIRRQHQLNQYAPHYKTMGIRGNIARRLEYLEQGYDAIIMAKAAWSRLALEDSYCSVDLPFIPSANQGMIAAVIQENSPLRESLPTLMDLQTTELMLIEKNIVAYLGGDCQMPLGVRAVYQDGGICLDVEWFHQNKHFCQQISGQKDAVIQKMKKLIDAFREGNI